MCKKLFFLDRKAQIERFWIEPINNVPIIKKSLELVFYDVNVSR